MIDQNYAITEVKLTTPLNISLRWKFDILKLIVPILDCDWLNRVPRHCKILQYVYKMLKVGLYHR